MTESVTDQYILQQLDTLESYWISSFAVAAGYKREASGVSLVAVGAAARPGASDRIMVMMTPPAAAPL